MSDIKNSNADSAKIKIVGIGGAGNNAIRNIVKKGINVIPQSSDLPSFFTKARYNVDLEYIAINTDAQHLLMLKEECDKILSEQGKELKIITIGKDNKENGFKRGQGAGGDPEKGRKAAEDSLEEIKEALKDANMVFLTAGLGGGTGTGATPVIAKALKEMDILTVAVLITPFAFEGERILKAKEALLDIQGYVDSYMVVSNEKLKNIARKDLTFTDVMKMADNVLYRAIKGIVEVISYPGYINLDFADVESVLRDGGYALIGLGSATGENRIKDALEKSVQNKLLTLNNIKGAERILVNVYGGPDIRMEEVTYVGEHIKNLTGRTDAIVYFGVIVDPKSTGKVEVTLIATGFSNSYSAEEIMDIPKDFDISKGPLAAFTTRSSDPMAGDESILELLLEEEER
ncbi:MAG TPA: cell division protein FtsZ [Desulfurobacteriaceae bacterium]|nr:cell division protein FtsZ [Desulfurobacteriaceae bacterium]